MNEHPPGVYRGGPLDGQAVPRVEGGDGGAQPLYRDRDGRAMAPEVGRLRAMAGQGRYVRALQWPVGCRAAYDWCAGAGGERVRRPRPLVPDADLAEETGEYGW